MDKPTHMPPPHQSTKTKTSNNSPFDEFVLEGPIRGVCYKAAGNRIVESITV